MLLGTTNRLSESERSSSAVRSPLDRALIKRKMDCGSVQKEKIAVTQGSGIEDTFIKTTYDNSLDSQISLLPLGFSLLFSPAVITSCHSLNHGPPGQRKGRRERRNQRSLKRKTGRTAGSTTNRRTCNSKSRESSGSASRTGKPLPS